MQQIAFCRIYRHGQEKETYITRFIANGSVDNHLVEMQDRKEEEIKNALDPDRHCVLPTTQQLLQIFSPFPVGNSNGFILVDDETALGINRREKTAKNTVDENEYDDGPRIVEELLGSSLQHNDDENSARDETAQDHDGTVEGEVDHDDDMQSVFAEEAGGLGTVMAG